MQIDLDHVTFMYCIPVDGITMAVVAWRCGEDKNSINFSACLGMGL